MKNLARLCHTRLQLLALGTGLFLAQNLFAATFSFSPATVSNTYSGTITLTIGGLTNGETVVIQKYLDLNGNGIIDAGEWLGQEFSLTDNQAGMVIGGVTNNNVPGDSNPANGVITAVLAFQNGDFSQNVSAKYLFKLSSPSARFAPITNAFTVTSFPYAQKFTGIVVSNGTATVVPNAVVLLFPSGGNGSPIGGTVADSSGHYTIPAPPGTYSAVAFRSGYIFNFETAPPLTLAAGATLTTNISSTNATSSVSGQVVDASNSNLVLPGIFVTAQATNGVIGVSFTDASGNFNIGVASNPGQWQVRAQDTSLLVHGYLAAQNKIVATNGQNGISLGVAKATALFYGNAQDNLGNPAPGLDIFANDNNSLYQTDGFTDANGNYVVGAIGGSNNDLWQVEVSSSVGPTTYLFSQPGFDQNGGTNISAGQAVQVNFTAILATNTISGTLKDGSGNPLAGIGVYANATINGVSYNQGNVDTDATGFYSINVANGTWNVGVNTGGGNSSLPANEFCPSQSVTISSANATANFIATTAPYTITGTLKDNNGNAIPGVSIYAYENNIGGATYNQNATTGADGSYTLNVVSGFWIVGVNSCIGCGQSLPANYLVPQQQMEFIAGNSVTANFIAILAPDTISGSLKDVSGNPIAGIGVYAFTSSSTGPNYNQNTQTDANGNYTLNVINGTWQVSIDTGGGTGSLPGGYLSPQSQTVMILNNNSTNNFTAILGTNYITGNVKANGANVVGVGVNANATINGTSYSQNTGTDANGNYSLSVANGSWSVYLDCNGSSDSGSLDNILGSGNYTCPNSQSATIAGNNSTNNFTIPVCSGVTISPTLPDGESGVFYDQFFQATGCNPPFTWSVNVVNGTLPAGFVLTLPSGELRGTTFSSGRNDLTFTFSASVTDGNGLTTNQTVSLTLHPAVQVMTTSLPNGTNGVFYGQILQASGGVGPYTWSLASGSANPPANVSLTQAGLLSGIPVSTGAFGFSVMVTDSLGATSMQALSITVAGSPLQITTISLPSASQNVFYTNELFASGGQPPYIWSLAPRSPSLPQGLTLGTNGGISGTITNSGTTNFTLLVTDALGATSSQLLTLVVIAQTGSLQVSLEPRAAINAGALWEVDGEALQTNDAIVTGLSVGTHTVTFNTISNYVTPSNQIVVITSGQTTTATGTYAQVQYGDLKVTLIPATIGAKWQVDGGKVESSGAIVTNLAAGNHIVSFTAISGYLTPANETVVVTGHSTNTASGTYVGAGSLQVTLSPAAAIAGGAQWQVDFGDWQNSLATVTNLPVGNHTVTYKGIDYWGTPVNQTVAIKLKTLIKATGTYTFNGAGIYNGLFMQPEVTVGTAGMLQNLTVTKSGTFTGKLLLGATTTSIAGAFNDAGQATNSLKPTKLGLVVLTMQVNWNSLPITIGGTVSGTNGGPWLANLTAELAGSELGSADYTALMGVPMGAADSPPGYGYLLITNHAGAVVLSGALADGTAISQSVPVSGVIISPQPSFNDDLQQPGDVLVANLPIYASLYGNTGLLIGWLNLESGAPAGSLAWIKEASHFSAYYTNGFTNPVVTLQGSTWTNPPAKTAAIAVPAGGVLDISGGLLAAPLQFNVGVSNNNALVKLSGSPTNSLTGTISTVNPTRGLLTITFGNGTGKATTIGKGAVLQNANSAGGYFLGKTNAGTFQLQP